MWSFSCGGTGRHYPSKLPLWDAYLTYFRGAEAMQEQEWLMQFFKWEHLQHDEARAVSKLYAELAEETLRRCPQNPERTVALRKLVEAKDCAVRAVLAGPIPWRDRTSGPVIGP
jgi:hypothetical protein